MWNYEKRLQFPVNIKKSDARAAQVIISQYGGPYISNLEVSLYLFLYKKMIQYFPPAGNWGIFYLHPIFGLLYFFYGERWQARPLLILLSDLFSIKMNIAINNCI